MAVIVVTRLRLRDPSFFDDFFASAVAVVEQAKNSHGNLGADVLVDANNTYWTRTAWQDHDEMQAFVGTEPHRSTMNRIDEWCDEATFVDWEQAGGNFPDWRESYGRLIADGQVAALTTPSDAHHIRDFPAPVVPS
jgi:heme-degrading monooxygenase HmoA